MARHVMKILAGPVTVAYRRRRGGWVCTALQFDLVGTGATRQKAFQELQEVVNAYLQECLQAKEPVDFFNPSEREEWNAGRKEHYSVGVCIAVPEGRPEAPEVIPDLRRLRMYRDRIQSFDLVPVGV